MPDVVTDTKTITIEVVAHGDLTVENLTYQPQPARPNQDFQVLYDIVNAGGTDSYYVELRDSSDNVLDRQTGTINEGQTISISHTHNISSAGTEVLTIEVGYVN